MIEFYPQIKQAHVAAVLTSGGLFLLRGLAVQLGSVRALHESARWAMSAPLRYLSYTIDTALLTAALMLLTVLRLNPFVTPWLGVKLLLLVAYIVLGSFALARARQPAARLATYLAALACFGFMYSVARAHHPLGILHTLGLA